VPKVFRTPADARSSFELVGVGLLGPAGKGLIVIDDAAAKMSELQDEQGKPLTGKRLEDAAQAFADARGLRVVNASDKAIANVHEEWGNPAPRPPAAEVARQEYQRTYAGLEPVNTDPLDGSEAGEPSPPPPASEAAQPSDDGGKA
jgi:hypothetical protein